MYNGDVIYITTIQRFVDWDRQTLPRVAIITETASGIVYRGPETGQSVRFFHGSGSRLSRTVLSFAFGICRTVLSAER